MEENYLLAKWLNNELTNDQLADFMASDEYRTYEKIRNYSAHLEVAELDEQKILSEVLSQKKTKPKVISLFKKWYVNTAAILVLGLGITFVIQNYSINKELANNAERKVFFLPDNSEVVLNSGSEIEYKKHNWDSNRNLNLKGEAYFKVAKGRKFEVSTNLGKVAVLGTQFNVKARNNRFDITCFEGRVKVNYNDIQIVLTHGQSVTFENGKQTNNQTTQSKPAWINDKIAFEKETLYAIIDEIQRQYNVTIEVKTKHKNALFTGELPTNNLDSSLQIIATTYHLKFSKTAQAKIIFEEK